MEKGRVTREGNTSLFLRYEKGVSLIEISLCLAIVSILLISVMNVYKEYMLRSSYDTAAKQISVYFDYIRQYIEKNSISDLNYSKEHCVAKLNNDLVKKILQGAADYTTISQKFEVFIRKPDCTTENSGDEKYFVLFAFSGGKEMNTTNAGRLAGMIGHRGGVYVKESRHFQGWKKEWRITSEEWGIKEQNYSVAAYDYFIKKQNPASGQAAITKIDLEPYPGGVASKKDKFIINSRDNKIKIAWYGVAIKYVNLTVTISGENGERTPTEIKALSHSYGGEYDFALPSVAEPGEYNFRVKAIVCGYNNRKGMSLEKELSITYE